MVLVLLLSDGYSDDAARPLSALSPTYALQHIAPGGREQHYSMPSSSSQELLIAAGPAVLHLANGLRAWRGEPLFRTRSGELPAPYLLLHEWSMSLVLLLLCGLALSLPLIYQKQAFQNCFSQFTAWRWNPKHLQYRFCHASL